MFTSIESVKRLDGSIRVRDADTTLESVVKGVNNKVVDYLDRYTVVDSYVDTFNLLPTVTATYKLKGYPVKEVVAVRVDGVAVSSKFYRVDKARGRLQVSSEGYLGLSSLEVEYVGGMYEEGQTVQDLYGTVCYASDVQALFEYKRISRIAHKSIAVTDAGTEQLHTYTLLPEVRRLLRPYRRGRSIG